MSVEGFLISLQSLLAQGERDVCELGLGSKSCSSDKFMSVEF